MASRPPDTATRSGVGVTVAPSVWMRRRSWTLTNAVLYGAMAAFWGWMAVYLAILGHMGHTTSATRAFFAVFTVAMTMLWAWVSVRIARSGLWIAADAIVLRGALRTRSFPLHAVNAFVPRADSRQQVWPWLQRLHGRPLAVTALSRWGRTAAIAQHLQPLCDELNALLKTLQAAHPSAIAPDPAAAREEAVRESRRTRAALLGTGGLYWVAAGIIIGQHPTARNWVVFGVVGALYTAFVCLTAWLVKKNAASLNIPPTPDKSDPGL
jgi:hypothetical protein